MRILWVTNDLPPRAGGIERFVGELVGRVDADQVVVLGPPHPHAATWDDHQPARIERWHTTVHPTPVLLRCIVELVHAHRIDVVVLGAAWPLGVLASRIRAVANVPVVALTHGLEAGLVTAGLGAVVRRTLSGLDVATTISDFTESRVRKAAGTTPLLRVAPGVDVDRYVPDEVARREIRSRVGIGPDEPVVGVVSRLVRRKGVDRLLDAWPEIRAHHPMARLVVVGEGPLGPRLARWTVARDPAQGVVLAGGVDGAELPSWYAAFDVFSLPCRTRWGGVDVEGLGIVTLEAQSVGLPVVVGNSGGAPEAVASSTTGSVVDGTDPHAIADAISGWLSSPERRMLAAEAGRQWTMANRSWPVIAQRFREMLDDVVRSVREA